MARKWIVKLMRYSGIPLLIRKFVQQAKVTIIYYHKVEASVFDRHLALLKKYYHIVPLQAYLNGQTKNIKNRLILTFDDGHASNFQLLPILKKHDARITIFITTGLIDSNRHFWFLINNLGEDDKADIKQLNDEERLEVLRKKYQYSDIREYEFAQALTSEQMLAMTEFVDFQSHTVSHPCLPKCSAEKALHEIAASKAFLEKMLAKDINCLAFPNNDYTEREIKMSRDSGYQYLFTANFGFNVDDENNYLLNRLSTNDTSDTNELLLRVTGIWKLLRFMHKK
jgi:peptidoglycan/xylan/chitin deacetylase (PgdA/CDA1 family)